LGHTRLGTIPKSKKWSTVISAVTGTGGSATTTLSEEIDQIASLTLIAAQKGLTAAIRDPGLNFAFFLLTKLVQASRSDEKAAQLETYGIQLGSVGSVTDLLSDFHAAIDQHTVSIGHTSDLSEFAQQAAGEALLDICANQSLSLFEDDSTDISEALRVASTKEGFARLGQRFFGRFMARFLNFYLSRITSAYIGASGLRDVGEIQAFNDALTLHCDESARVVRDFCGQWYSKTEFERGITEDNIHLCVSTAIKKLQSELKHQEGDS
jgi:hypothetical protein